MMNVSDFTQSRQSVTVSYLLLIAVWSTTPLMIVLSIRELDALWALLFRFGLASLILLGIVGLTGLGFPLSRHACRIYAIGGVGLFWTMVFTYLGAKTVSSGLISIAYGLSPLFAGLIGHGVLKNERLDGWQWSGIGIALMGLILVFGTAHLQKGMVLGLFYLLLAVAGYVISIFWLKYENSQLHPMVQTAGSTLVATTCLLLLMPWMWSAYPRVMPSHVTLFVVAYSAVFSSVIAIFCYFSLITRIKSATLALATIIPPVIACVLGMLFNDEVITWRLFLGIVVVMGGLLSYFSAYWRTSPLSI